MIPLITSQTSLTGRHWLDFSPTSTVGASELSGIRVVSRLPIKKRPSNASSLGSELEDNITFIEDWANATSRNDPSELIEPALRHQFHMAREERFEDGFESDFSRSLTALIRQHGRAALMALARIMIAGDANPEVVAEALRWLGNMHDPDTYNNRLLLLERNLTSPDPRIRDGALLGLTSLADPAAVPALQHAIEREHIPELRHNMQQVLEYLESLPLQTER